VFGEFSYDHPQFGNNAMDVQARLKAIQGDNHTQFAGAWTGYGFHEDGLTSGIAAAEALGATLPGMNTQRKSRRWRTPDHERSTIRQPAGVASGGSRPAVALMLVM
jgi:predicted NAD/FAD-binding protein